MEKTSAPLLRREEAPFNTQVVLAGCQSLLFQDKKLIGDPIELLFFEKGSEWEYTSNDKMARNKKGDWLRITNLFPFRSDLKRMSTIIYMNGGYRVLTKGAPETIKSLLKSSHPNYDQVYSKYTKQGYRVLALAYKSLDVQSINLDDVSREQVEFDLEVIITTKKKKKKNKGKQKQKVK